MATGAAASRVCLLIQQRIRRYTEREVTPLTKEMEKDLLISLSQVLREIQRWTSEIGSDSAMTSSLNRHLPFETGEHFVDNGDSTATRSITGSEGYRCLERIVADFVGLLGMKNLYVQHLASNILLEVSEFLVESEGQWDVFIRLLCDYVYLAIIKVLPCSAVFANRFGGLDLSLSGSVNVLKRKLQNANWYTVSGIFRVLRNTWKYLNQEDNGELLDVYLKSISFTLANIPWYLLDGTSFRQLGDGECNPQGQSGTLGSITDREQGTVFLGGFVRFLCSLVQQSSFLEDSGSFEPAHPILPKIIDLVPYLLRWCRPKQESPIDTSMSRYLMHKLLVLMIRLSYQSDLECATLLSWLQLLELHFQDFLQQPISGLEPAQDNCLDGSPFLSSFSDGEVGETCSCHLQRLAVFLFLRCSFSLISLRRHTNKQCKCDGRKKGMQDIFQWIKQQIPSYSFPDNGTYIEKSIEFSTSFIKLYMHEDDLLFKVLLQLLSATLHGEKRCEKGKLSLQDEEQIILFHISTLFNPVNLFHIFLSELRYDHQVLLDYLISKDIGTSCAEYLLRCLRTVCDSWNLFMEFPSDERAGDVSSSKKRKGLSESFKVERAGLLSCLPGNISTDDEHNQKHHGTGKRRAFEAAKSCLLSLKNSVDNLHQKKLFPYNPEVLLKRLARFGELCLDHE